MSDGGPEGTETDPAVLEKNGASDSYRFTGSGVLPTM